MILQLKPSILVETPLGTGLAIFIIDYGMHQNSCWVVALQVDGVVKHFDCNDIIMSTNYTYGMNLKKNHFECQRPQDIFDEELDESTDENQLDIS